MKTSDFDPFYGVTKSANYIGIHRTTLDRWRKDGVAPEPDGYTPTGGPRWKRSTLDRMLRESRARMPKGNYG